ncbi:oxidoreductase [Myxococcota bacterium]|nr:oxidoreductase [Myxococcota bacterium]
MLASADALPDLTGRTYLITGANSGLGYYTALGLGKKGARVIMACRNPSKAADALAQLKAAGATGCETVTLDLASLDSVQRLAETINASGGPLHGLINNAGIMATPHHLTQDGFEAQIGTNHLGHFALTGRLLPTLLRTPGARVVNVSSYVHRFGTIRLDDLMMTRGYARWPAYFQSKLANLLFTLELKRRAQGRLLSLASHPGYADTNLQTAGAKMEGSKLAEGFFGLGGALFAQSAERGALPSLLAAAAAEVEDGAFYGPSLQLWGAAGPTTCAARARDEATARALWERSVSLTGVSYAELG